jgi:hypothetical protein
LVVLVLVVLWAVVLTPMTVKRFRQVHTDGSIDSFHEQLHLLERAGPKLVAPAHRLETSDVPMASSATSHSTRRSDLALVGSAGAAELGPRMLAGSGAGPAGSWSRRQVCRRLLREVLGGLVATVALTGGFGALHGLHLLWVVTTLAVLSIAGYVALAAYAQLIEADRRSYRPTAVALPTPPTSAHGGSPGDEAAHLGPAVVALGARIPAAARAGFPGAWDDELSAEYEPRQAATGT